MGNDRLHYRRQFLLTPEPRAAFSNWQHASLGDLHLYAHPDVELNIAASPDSTIVAALVGYIINPYHPERSNADELKTIIKAAGSFDEITDYLCSLSGRFVLAVKTPEDTFLFHDPCGLRSIYYTRHDGKPFAASQPTIFKHVLPLEDGDRLRSYLNSTYAQNDLEHWLPSGCSLYPGVYHLVPNHALRLSTMEQMRYWPKRPIVHRPVNEVAVEASELLGKLMIAANKKFELSMPLTAGWDSRTLLGASKSISSEVYFYTLQYRALNPKSHDIMIPQKLLRTLGLRHNLIDCRKEVPEWFRELYEQNSSLAHMDDWGKIAYGMMDAYPPEKVCLKGNCSEILRCFYYKHGKHPEIVSPDQIIALESGWDAIPFIYDPISAWLNEAREVSAQTGMDILDLFYMEHRMGSWQAQSQLEWDIVQEAYTPFNHRGLIELMLGAPSKYRRSPNYLLYKMMINILWPEAMKQPINPPTAKDLLKRALPGSLYGPVRRIYRQILKKGIR